MKTHFFCPSNISMNKSPCNNNFVEKRNRVENILVKNLLIKLVLHYIFLHKFFLDKQFFRHIFLEQKSLWIILFLNKIFLGHNLLEPKLSKLIIIWATNFYKLNFHFLPKTFGLHFFLSKTPIFFCNEKSFCFLLL